LRQQIVITRNLLIFAGLPFFLMLAAPLQAQLSADDWQPIPFGDGEKTPVINQIVIDGGVLWIATDSGLWRFDGRAARQWDEDEPTDTRSLLIDSDDRLWIGTTRGLIVLDADRDWSKRVELLPELHEPVWALEAASAGGVWAGTDRGLYYISSVDDKAVSPDPIGLSTDAIHALSQTVSGDLWIGTRDNGLFLLKQTDDGQPQITEIAAETHPRINTLLLSEEGQLWIGTERGLCILKNGDSAAACRLPQFDEFEGEAITGLFPDASTPDAIWIATPDRLWHYTYPANLSSEDLRSTDVRTLVGDDEGQLWAGATSGLLLRHSPAWKPLLADVDRDLQDVLSVVEDNQGVLWVGTDGGLLRQEPDGRWQAVEELESQTIRCLFASKHESSLWACLDHGVAQIDISDAASSPPMLVGETVNDIWQEADGTLWFATRDGVWQKTGTDLKQHRSTGDSAGGLASNFVTSLAGDGQGGFWAGTTAGLSYFDGSNWQPPTCPVLGDEINDLLWDSARNQLWVATRDGLALCDREAYIFQPTEGEIIDDNIRILALEGAHEGENRPAFLLAGTFEGLSRVDIRDPRLIKLPVTSFNKDSHLPDNRIQALYVRDDGQLLLGTPDGLYAYQPSNQAPELHFCHPECSDFDSLRHPGEPLTIVYNDEEPLRLFGHDLRTDADNLLYRFEIVSGDTISQTWSATGDLNLSTNLLPPNEDMTIKAWAYDRDFNPSSQPAVLSIMRQPKPLLLQPLFIAGLISLTLIVGGILYWQWRKFRLYGYRDLELIVSPGAEPTHHLVRFKSSRGVDFQEEHQLNWALIEEPLSHIEADESNDELLRYVGRQLYDSLFSKEAAAQLQQKLALGRKGIRLRLRFDNLPQLATLPWELLHGGDDLKFLTIQSNVAIVRDYSAADAQLNRMERPLKLLLVTARPSDMPDIGDAVATEFEAIKTFAEEATANQVVVTVLDHATPQKFWEALKSEFVFIHFIGHGGLREGQGVLYLEDDDGQTVAVDQTSLAAELNKPATFTNQTPKLFFLNACRTAEADNRAGITGLATTLVTDGNLPAVIGMGYPIASESAARFSQFFYKTLIQHGQVDYAVAEGRKALFGLEGSDLRDWATPRLYLSVEKGIVFDLT
jgi:ligand-binding sensor domain-containing protein